MLYFLDTNICIHYMRKGVFTDRIRSRIIQYGLRSIKIPAIVTGELMCGAYKSKRPEKTLKETLDFLKNFDIVPFGEREADIYGQIRADLERKGHPIGNNDMLIAATALSCNATLVTNNTEEFSRIASLNLTDWTI